MNSPLSRKYLLYQRNIHIALHMTWKKDCKAAPVTVWKRSPCFSQSRVNHGLWTQEGDKDLVSAAELHAEKCLKISFGKEMSEMNTAGNLQVLRRTKNNIFISCHIAFQIATSYFSVRNSSAFPFSFANCCWCNDFLACFWECCCRGESSLAACAYSWQRSLFASRKIALNPL